MHARLEQRGVEGLSREEVKDNESGAEPRRQGRLGERLSESLANATDSARQRLQQSGEAISDARESAQQGLAKASEQASEQATEVVQGLQRSGEVLTGADIRKFDEFTEAVTRVCVGLYQDNVQLREQVAGMERQLEEATKLQAELAGRVAALEQQDDYRAGSPNKAQE